MWISHWQPCTKGLQCPLLLAFPVACLPSCCTQFTFISLLPNLFQSVKEKNNPKNYTAGYETESTHIRYWMKYPPATYVHVFWADLILWHTTTPCARLNEGLDVKKAPCSHLPETGCSGFFHYRWQRSYSFNSKWSSKEFCVQKVLFC